MNITKEKIRNKYQEINLIRERGYSRYIDAKSQIDHDSLLYEIFLFENVNSNTDL